MIPDDDPTPPAPAPPPAAPPPAAPPPAAPAEELDASPLLSAAGEKAMGFLDHLDELRTALGRTAVVTIILIGVAWAFSDRLLDSLIAYLLHGERALALTPGEAFSARMQVALWTGGLVAIPYILLEAWWFVAPGLKKNERHFAIPWMVASGLLLYSGVVFALELLLPAMVSMLRSFATSQMEARVSITSLLDFTVKLAVGCGLLFQMPLVICLAAWFGLVSPRILARSWRHAIFFIALGAAVVTPGDGPSMLILSAPLIVLYFISVVMAWVLWRARGRGADHPTVWG
ncbi:MAG TPA: twin-arginine translocase subunit TatC [Candidatus Eisenbacteria bacterium]|nr:twin-arginine translocase subunit TatC [Candidatus Eisenbacteria bacterium]